MGDSQLPPPPIIPLVCDGNSAPPGFSNGVQVVIVDASTIKQVLKPNSQPVAVSQ